MLFKATTKKLIKLKTIKKFGESNHPFLDKPTDCIRWMEEVRLLLRDRLVGVMDVLGFVRSKEEHCDHGDHGHQDPQRGHKIEAGELVKAGQAVAGGQEGGVLDEGVRKRQTRTQLGLTSAGNQLRIKTATF